LYTVTLNASNTAGSNLTTKTNYINISFDKPSYTYNISHMINGSSSGTVTGYPVTMVLWNTSGTSSSETCYLGSAKTRTDWGDIRFSQDNVTDLPYWIETASLNATSARFWINMSSITGGTTTQTPLFVYFGNSSKTNVSNGSRTFPFFDDFDNGTTLDTTKWTAGGTPTISGGEITLASTGGWVSITSNSNFNYTGISIRTRIYPSTVSQTSGYIQLAQSIDPNYFVVYYTHTVAGNVQKLWQRTNADSKLTTVQGLTTPKYYIQEISRLPTYAISSIDNANSVSTPADTSYPTVTAPIATSVYYNGISCKQDWVLVRPYVSSEPTHSTYAGGSIATSVASFTSNITGGYPSIGVQFNDTSSNTPTSWNWSFGDGTYNESRNATHTYNSWIGNTLTQYTVILNVTNAGGSNTSTRTNYITAYPLTSSFTSNNTRGGSPFPVQFNATYGNGTATNWNWTLTNVTGNNTETSFGTERNASYIFGAGNFSIKLNTSNSYGFNVTTTTYFINVSNQTPSASISTNVTSGYPSFTVKFNDTSSYYPTSWNWSFGDGTYSESQNGTHTYNAVIGNTITQYNMVLQATNLAGTGTSAATVITAYPLTSSFSANRSVGSSPLPVLFTSTYGNGTANTWNWMFANVTGNNTEFSFSTSQNPTQSFGFGNFSIRLNASNTYSFNISPTVSFINVTTPIIVNLTSNVTPGTTSGAAPLAVQFYDTGSSPYPSISAWSWSFANVTGNGTEFVFSTSQNPIYTFGVGNYSIRLNASNTASQIYNKSTANTYFVNVSFAITPVSNFTSNVTSGVAPLVVSFTDLTRNVPTAWSWKFADVAGNNTQFEFSTAQNPTYTFNEGSFRIRLNSSNSAGYNISYNPYYYILVGPIPSANFTESVTSGLAPLTVTFNDTSEVTALSWAWDVNNDGTTEFTTQNCTYTYTTPGTYTVRLDTVTATGVAQKIKSNLITAGSLAIVDFTANATSGDVPMAVSFTDASTDGYPAGTAYAWAWDVNNDGVVESTARNFTYTYTTSGLKSVRYNVTTTMGMNSTIKMSYIAVNTTILPFPGYTDLPTNVGTGDIYQDINGNGHLDFDDIVAFFESHEWAIYNQPVQYFDYNYNTRLDWNDVIIEYDVVSV
jgi:PKD repeat protein